MGGPVPARKDKIRKLNAFAFVVPYFDYVDIDDISPSVDDDGVGWIAWGWNVKRRTWTQLPGFFDIEDEARKVARAHHIKVFKQLGITGEPFQQAVA